MTKKKAVIGIALMYAVFMIGVLVTEFVDRLLILL